jgi:hypothetical protein
VSAPPSLRADQAQKIAAAEAAYAHAKRALEEAKLERDAMRERYSERVPLGKVIVAGGLTIKRRVQSTGKRFALAQFLVKHKLTAAMRPYVSENSYEVWDVRPAPSRKPAGASSANGRRDGLSTGVATRP